MVRFSVLFALGVWALQQQPSLPERPGLWLLACLALFCGAVLAPSARALRIEFKAGKNPFEGKKRALTESEQRAAHRARIRGRRLYS